MAPSTSTTVGSRPLRNQSVRSWNFTPPVLPDSARPGRGGARACHEDAPVGRFGSHAVVPAPVGEGGRDAPHTVADLARRPRSRPPTPAVVDRCRRRLLRAALVGSGPGRGRVPLRAGGGPPRRQPATRSSDRPHARGRAPTRGRPDPPGGAVQPEPPGARVGHRPDRRRVERVERHQADAGGAERGVRRRPRPARSCALRALAMALLLGATVFVVAATLALTVVPRWTGDRWGSNARGRGGGVALAGAGRAGPDRRWP